MRNPYMAAATRQAVIGSRTYPVSYLTGELKELAVEILHFRRDGMVEEFGDCAYAAQMLVSQVTGWDWKLLCCRQVVEKFLFRIKQWEAAFAERGVEFSVDYLVGGSNYQKTKKVVAAFALAGHEISEAEARVLFF